MSPYIWPRQYGSETQGAFKRRVRFQVSAFYDPLIPGNIEKRDAEIQRVFRELDEQEVSLRADGGGRMEEKEKEGKP